MSAVVVLESEGDTSPRGVRALVDAARRADAAWIAISADGEDAAPVRAAWRAASDAGLGLVLRLGDTRLLADLESAIDVAGERSVPALRDRLLVVVASERAGKRLRTDAAWAPSAADLGAFRGGLLGLLRRRAPNFVRATCVADDLVVPLGLLPDDRLPPLAAKLRSRGGRLWLSNVPQERAEALATGPWHGIVVARCEGVSE